MWPKLFCWWEQILVQLNKILVPVQNRESWGARGVIREALSVCVSRSIYCSPRWKLSHGQIVRAEIVAPPGMMRGCWGARSEGDRASVRSSDGNGEGNKRAEGRTEDLEWEATSTKDERRDEKKEREGHTRSSVWTGNLVDPKPDWGPVPIALQALSLVEKEADPVQVRFRHVSFISYREVG
jgi:hypothetical protein